MRPFVEIGRSGTACVSPHAEGASALDGAEALRRLTSVFEMGRQKGEVPLPENESVSPDRIIQLHRSSTDHVREGAF